MFETYSLAFMATGAALVVLTLMWMVIRSFRISPYWGMFCAVGLGLPFFIRRHRDRARLPLLGLIAGAILFAGPLLYNRFAPPDLGPREKIVDGKRHLTLTGWNPDRAGSRRWLMWINVNVAGWDRLDYSLLRTKPDTAVLQMANADVDDATLDHLAGMNQLEELDLNDTKVTDRGLPALARLPALRSLRLRGAAITDDGFRAHLMPLERLRELELTGTAVRSATIREWKAAVPDRKAVH